MNGLQSQIKNYLEFCEYQKRLDRKTIKAYRIDLQQFSSYFETAGVHDCTEINWYIQDMPGHSSISITQIYTHVTVSKQRDILSTMHPRKDFCI